MSQDPNTPRSLIRAVVGQLPEAAAAPVDPGAAVAAPAAAVADPAAAAAAADAATESAAGEALGSPDRVATRGGGVDIETPRALISRFLGDAPVADASLRPDAVENARAALESPPAPCVTRFWGFWLFYLFFCSSLFRAKPNTLCKYF
jgi:hypothetical protein